MLKEFKQFLIRGNVVDLAVGVVIGAAFGTVVTSLVKDILTPLIGAVGHQPDFSHMNLVIRGSAIAYGSFLNALISFVIVSAAIFFAVVKPVNHLMARAKRGQEKQPDTKNCPECLSEVPKQATRCAFCGIKLD